MGERRRLSKPEVMDDNTLFIAEYAVNQGMLKITKPSPSTKPVTYSSNLEEPKSIPIEDNLG